MSEWYQIENQNFILQTTTKGAELKRLFAKKWNRELLWSGDAKIWNRSAPILFPIVGKLKQNEFVYEGKTYTLPQHGFARDSEFECRGFDSDRIEFLLSSNKQTKSQYPFSFDLLVEYLLSEEQIQLRHTIENKGTSEMLFSIGGHPGLSLLLGENYEIRFEKVEKNFYRPKAGLVDWGAPKSFNSQILKIENNLFQNDAFIFKKPKSKYIELVGNLTGEIIRVSSHQVPYWGIWSKDEQKFVCIEPWCGVADLENHNKNLKTKEGMITLAPGKKFEFNYFISIFKLDLPKDR